MKIEINETAIDYAKSVSISDLKKLIKSIKKGEYDEFSDRCRVCFENYLNGNLEQAAWWSRHAELVRPKKDDKRGGPEAE